MNRHYLCTKANQGGWRACILALVLGLLGCGGGGENGPVYPGDLSVGEIKGANSIAENGFEKFSIDVEGYSEGCECEWMIDPPFAAYLTDSESTSVILCAREVDSDTVIELSVTVKSRFKEPQTRAKAVSIQDTVPTDSVPEVFVSEIVGPDWVRGKTWATFGVEVSGPGEFDYKWSVKPPDAGHFGDISSRYVNFGAEAVGEDIAVTVRVEVTPAGDSTQCREKTVTVLPSASVPQSLSVGHITGPGSVKEGGCALFSITAMSELPPEYYWQIEPPSLGVLIPENGSPSVTFAPNTVTHDTTGTLKVRVVSADQEIIRERKVCVLNQGPVIAWLNAPREVVENDQVNYGLKVVPFPGPIVDTPFPLNWEIFPQCAGTFIAVPGLSSRDEYFTTSTNMPEVLFRSSEVEQDTSATITVSYWIDSDLNGVIDSSTDERIVLSNYEITVLDNSSESCGGGFPDDDDHLYSQLNSPIPVESNMRITGPTVIVKEIEGAYFYGILGGQEDWNYSWKCQVVDDWDKYWVEGWDEGCPPSDPHFEGEWGDYWKEYWCSLHVWDYSGPVPLPEFGSFVPTERVDGVPTSRIVEFIPRARYPVPGRPDWPELSIPIMISVTCEAGTFCLPVAVLTPLKVCLDIEQHDPFWFSWHDDGGPEPPTSPERNLDFDYWTKYVGDKYFVQAGDHMRLFVSYKSYRPSDVLTFEWQVIPALIEDTDEQTVHFWGDWPYELPQEILWQEPQWWTDFSPPGIFAYTIAVEGEGEGFAGVEFTCHSNDMFEILLTIKSEECGTYTVIWRFNSH